jgi:hypothetical protein
MMALLLAEIRTNQAKTEANQAKTGANLSEMREEIRTPERRNAGQVRWPSRKNDGQDELRAS